MEEEFKCLIAFITNEYIKMNCLWRNDKLYKKINFNKILVKDIYNEKDVFETILNYRAFLNEKNIEFVENIQKFNTENITISARVKAINSIEYKIKNYVKNHENGEIPIKKCINDLFGVRIICNEKMEYNFISEFVGSNYPKLKCINSSKKEYVATHIYFRENNNSFPWELQIWSKDCEKSNIRSHALYKQDYTKWEAENKGGVF